MAKKRIIDYRDLKRKLEDAKERIEELEENFEETIEEHPIKSVAIAFGAGMLSGALLYMLARKK